MYIGSVDISKIYNGLTEVSKIYLGTNLIFENGGPGPEPVVVISLTEFELYVKDIFGNYTPTDIGTEFELYVNDIRIS